MLALRRNGILPRVPGTALPLVFVLATGCSGAGPQRASNAITNTSTAASTTAPKRAPERVPEPTSSVAFEYVGQSWMRVPAQIGTGPASAMMVDTGMGVTLLTPEACARAGCMPEGTWSGKRMSGQSIELAIARVSSLTVAGHRVENARVAVFASDDVIHRDLGVEGIAGLDVFRDQAVTFDHPSMRVVLESAASLGAREAAGTKVAVRIKNDGPATEVYLPLEIAKGTVAEMEVDSGSLHMILDDRFMGTLGIDPASPSVPRKEGRDETGQPYTRRYAKLPRDVPVAGIGARKLGVAKDATVMFQKIIHDGLLGQQFLREHVVTFDIPHASMIFGR